MSFSVRGLLIPPQHEATLTEAEEEESLGQVGLTTAQYPEGDDHIGAQRPYGVIGRDASATVASGYVDGRVDAQQQIQLQQQQQPQQQLHRGGAQQQLHADNKEDINATTDEKATTHRFST